MTNLPVKPFEFDAYDLPSPCYLVDEGRLRANLKILADVQERTGATVLLALKGFAMWSTFPIVREYLRGVCASSLAEAQLGAEEFGGEVHAYAPAYKKTEMEKYLRWCSHMSFNSFNQFEQLKPLVDKLGGGVSCGLRINPEHSEVATKLYDPCAPGSRLGIRAVEFEGKDLSGVDGLHFHTLCELNSDALARTLPVVEEKFGKYFGGLKWMNFGGGHHITRPDYDVDLLCELVTQFKERWPLEVYLEPGEAIALNTGVLVTEVLDIIHNEVDIAILDTSATAHMPDVLEMPYRPQIVGGADPGALPNTYRLGGLTCLAGDVIGDWSFAKPLKQGDRLIFLDMAHYTMVKNTTFNGVQLPAIAIQRESGDAEVVREFGYEDYKRRLS
jgi:carboxynorspermidine decarboxylase